MAVSRGAVTQPTEKTAGTLPKGLPKVASKGRTTPAPSRKSMLNPTRR